MSHINIIIDGEAMAARGGRIQKVAGCAGAYIHGQLTGWQDWDAELAILGDAINNGTKEDIDTQLTTMEGMMPSE
jgi:hypothetical protein